MFHRRHIYEFISLLVGPCSFFAALRASAFAIDCTTYQDRIAVSAKNQTLPDTYRELRTLLRDNPDDPCVEYALGLYYKQCRNFEQALEHFNKAAKLNPSYHGVSRELAWLYDAFRERGKARSYYQSAIQLAQNSHDLRGEAEALIGLGLVEKLTGNLDKALSMYSEALSLSKRAKRPDVEASALERMASLLVQLDDLTEAEIKARQALKIHRDLKDPRIWYNFANLGMIHEKMGETASDPNLANDAFARAIVSYEEAEKSASYWDHRQIFTVARGGVYLKQGDDVAAIKCYQSFLANPPEKTLSPGLIVHHIDAIGGLGLIEQKRGHFEQALKYFQEAVRLSQLEKGKAREMSWKRRIGDLYAQIGEQDKAHALYDEVLREAKDGFLALGTEERYLFFDEESNVYEAVVDLLLKMAMQHPEHEYAREALDYAEQARGQSIMQALFESRTASQLDPNVSELQRKVDRLWESRLEKRSQLQEANAGHLETAAQLANDVKTLEVEIDSVYKSIVRLMKNRLNNYEVSGVAQAIQKSHLDNGQTLIEYMVTDDKTFVFLINRERVAYEILPVGRKGRLATDGKPPQMSIEQALQRISSLFPRPFGAPPRSGRIDARSADIKVRGLEEFYELIFQPIEKHLQPGQSLIIVPDDLLYYLPFEMLVTKFQGTAGPEYLLARYPISYAYSGNMLLGGQPRQDGRVARALLVANPDFGTASSNGGSRSGLRLEPLPYTEREVRSVQDVVQKCVLLTGANATETSFKREAPQAGLIHIATHGIFDRRNYLDSSIVFARNERVDQHGEDGQLYFHEIMNMRLSASLVVMTGCETGLGHLRKGRGLEGVSRAFWAAGVPSVMGTLWPIADNEGTAKLTASLYRHLANGMDKRQALQKAKLDLLVDPHFADPFYWAPLILIGDPSPIHIAQRNHTVAILSLATLPALLSLAYWAHRRRKA